MNFAQLGIACDGGRADGVQCASEKTRKVSCVAAKVGIQI